MEWGPYGIRLNAIAPGLFPTEGAWSRLMPGDPSLIEKYKKKVPLGRFGQHEELANLAVFLMSDMASYITGECVTIDGGERLQSGQFNTLAQLMPREKLKEVFRMMKPKKD
jgi:NAD(P)-dependent dehydrogenase (short-subunit alcohol dehydrogenase family)